MRYHDPDKLRILGIRARRLRWVTVLVRLLGRPFQKNNRGAASEKIRVFEAFEEARIDNPRQWDTPPRAKMSVSIFYTGDGAPEPDKVAKFYLDALEGTAYTNDRQVKVLEVINANPPRMPKALLTAVLRDYDCSTLRRQATRSPTAAQPEYTTIRVERLQHYKERISLYETLIDEELVAEEESSDGFNPWTDYVYQDPGRFFSSAWGEERQTSLAESDAYFRWHDLQLRQKNLLRLTETYGDSARVWVGLGVHLGAFLGSGQDLAGVVRLNGLRRKGQTRTAYLTEISTKLEALKSDLNLPWIKEMSGFVVPVDIDITVVYDDDDTEKDADNLVLTIFPLIRKQLLGDTVTVSAFRVIMHKLNGSEGAIQICFLPSGYLWKARRQIEKGIDGFAEM